MLGSNSARTTTVSKVTTARVRGVRSGRRRIGIVAAACIMAMGGLVGSVASVSAATTYGAKGSGGAVLLVGTFDGHAGKYTTIQSAVNAAKPGDWILVGPGDYHETADESGLPTDPADGVHGWRRDRHVGHPPAGHEPQQSHRRRHQGRRSGACSSTPADQNYGARAPTARPYGRNGIVVWKADDVSIENLTACNFLAGTGDSGNEIWWNGGADSGKIGLKGYSGSYLTATSTYFSTVGTADQQEATAAQYGIFSSNSAGPGTWNQLYANNFNDSGMYVGACHQAVRHDHRPRLDGVQRPRVLGDQLGRSGRHRELAVRQQPGRVRHQHPDRRRPAGTAERRLPARRHQPHHPHPLVLGVHPQLRARQQQPRRARGRGAPPPARSARA